MPAGMVFVPGGDYRLVAWSRPTDCRVRLDDYFIDKYEVSNRDYKEFINAGGYVKRDYWPPPFVKDGARSRGTTRCGCSSIGPGCRVRAPGRIRLSRKAKPTIRSPTSRWYEAAAYAAFRGKPLPTVFQWEKAARNGVIGRRGRGSHAVGRLLSGRHARASRQLRQRALPVTSSQFGMSPFGAYNMAGNVAEWTSTTALTAFSQPAALGAIRRTRSRNLVAGPGFFSSDKLGFRCVATRPTIAGDQGGARIEIAQEIPAVCADVAAAFAKLATAYRYEKTPLDARIEETKDTPDWKREKITFNGVNGERATAYLYLPLPRGRCRSCTSFRPAMSTAGFDR